MLWAVAMTVWFGGAAGPSEPTPASAVVPCPPEAARCFDVRLWVATGPDGAAQEADWLAAQLAQANICFAAAGVGLRVVSTKPLPADALHVASRGERDVLGRERWDPRYIDVYVVGRLDDVDEDGEIRGVHWRDRADRERRWIIVSAIAPVHVLAHELGHYFGLGHSRHVGGVMSKLPDDPTPAEARRFSPTEIRRVSARARRLNRPTSP